MKYLIVISLLIFSGCSLAERNLVLVTIDGLRWQEVFRGAQKDLLENNKFVKDPQSLSARFGQGTAEQKRRTLMPFFWQTIATEGSVIGNRDRGSTMSVANKWFFSYPGYSEIFTGTTNPQINSNAKVNNNQVSFLEWLNNKPEYDKKLAAFGSWDVFPYILNVERSQLHVNAGFAKASGYQLSAEAELLNQLQDEIPSPWANVRLDSFTYRFAKDYLLTIKPRVISISLGETDDFAHDGEYDHYLDAAYRTDRFLADLWQTIQATEGYKNNTNLMIVTDHGRGSTANDWQHHASVKAIKGYMKGLKQFPRGIEGAEHIWFAAIGPDVKNAGEIVIEKEFKQKQVAATALKLLGESPLAFNPEAGAVIEEVLK